MSSCYRGTPLAVNMFRAELGNGDCGRGARRRAARAFETTVCGSARLRYRANVSPDISQRCYMTGVGGTTLDDAMHRGVSRPCHRSPSCRRLRNPPVPHLCIVSAHIICDIHRPGVAA